MAVTSCLRCKGYPKTKRVLDGRGTLAIIKTTHQDRYEIKTDSEDDIADIILDQLPMRVGDVFVGSAVDLPNFLVEISLDRSTENRLLWYADCNYEEGVLGDGVTDNSPPDQLIPEWSWSAETIDREWFIDAFGDQIATSAGERINLTMPLAIPVLSIERYESWFDPGTIVDFVNHINSAPFWGGGRFQVLCAAIEDRRDSHVIFQNQYYRRVKYVFKFAVPFIEEVLEGWLDVIVDHGTYYLDSNGSKIHFKAGGSETTGNLNGFGRQAADGEYFVGRFSRFPLADFNLLGL